MTTRHGLLVVAAAFAWWLICQWSSSHVRLEVAITDHRLVVEIVLPASDGA